MYFLLSPADDEATFEDVVDDVDEAGEYDAATLPEHACRYSMGAKWMHLHVYCLYLEVAVGVNACRRFCRNSDLLHYCTREWSHISKSLYWIFCGFCIKKNNTVFEISEKIQTYLIPYAARTFARKSDFRFSGGKL